MNRDTLKAILERIPVPIIFLAVIGLLFYDWYGFQYSEESPLKAKEAGIEGVQSEISRLSAQKKNLEIFKATLEQRRQELRMLAQKLEDQKAGLSDSFDAAGFMKLAVTEARKTGLTVEKINPLGGANPKEFYAEHNFELGIKGVYVQLLVFLQRLSQMQTIVRVENVTIKPTGSRLSGFVQLQGAVTLKGYHYMRSKADEVSLSTGAGSATTKATQSAPPVPQAPVPAPSVVEPKGGP